MEVGKGARVSIPEDLLKQDTMLTHYALSIGM